MNKLLKLMAFTLMLCSSVVAMAQASTGDKLFLEGQTLQKTLTLASQNSAIKKFQAAKAVYTTADKKKMCDNQIAICNSNIKSLSTKKPATTRKKAEPEPEPEPEPVVTKRTDVKLSLSDTRLDFKYKPKAGATQSVEVNCNYDDWFVASKPDWVEVYKASSKINVEVQENKDENERSGIVVLKCEDTEVSLIINQERPKAGDKIMGGVKDLFKKKK